MPKRRRMLFTPIKYKIRPTSKCEKSKTENSISEVSTARGRLKGALLDVLDPAGAESDASSEPSPRKRDRRESSSDKQEYVTDEEAKRMLRKSPPKQSYVLKLFDRSVDLSQFREDSPLYPICRAWIANQPKANYKEFGNNDKEEEPRSDGEELPGPEGPPVSRIPDLLPEQKAASVHNINLKYEEGQLPTKEQLLRSHIARWAAVRQAWLDQAALVEARYEGTQKVLNRINVEYLNSR